MIDAEFRAYFREQQVSLQWLPVLRALAAELEARESAETLRALFSAVGSQVAAEAVERLSQPDTLAALEQGLNDFWSLMHWGWVRLQDQGHTIGLAHCACPLVEAFGADSAIWSCGFLEGFYQTIFTRLGAVAELHVRWRELRDEDMTMTFDFGA